MREISYIKQPTEYLCGQTCVAMIANASVDDVIRVMGTDKGTGKKDIETCAPVILYQGSGINS